MCRWNSWRTIVTDPRPPRPAGRRRKHSADARNRGRDRTAVQISRKTGNLDRLRCRKSCRSLLPLQSRSVVSNPVVPLTGTSQARCPCSGRQESGPGRSEAEPWDQRSFTRSPKPVPADGRQSRRPMELASATVLQAGSLRYLVTVLQAGSLRYLGGLRAVDRRATAG